MSNREREHKTANDITGAELYDESWKDRSESRKWNHDPDADWYKRWRFWASTLVAPTVVTATAGAANLVYADGAVAAVELVAAVAATAVASKSFTSKLSQHLTWGATATAGASAQAFATTVGTPYVALVAWGAASAAAVAAKLVYRHNTRNDRYERMERLAKAETAQIKQKMAEAKYDKQTATVVAPAGPDLMGATPEEAAIRIALWDALKAAVISCPVTHTLTGWNATIGLKDVGRDQVRAGLDKLETRLALDGRLTASNGRRTNELNLKFVSNTAPSVDATWSPDLLNGDQS